MKNFDEVCIELRNNPKVWTVTGVAGFIGSNIAEKLLSTNQIVIGLDNFSTGNKKNLDQLKASVSEENYKNFTFVEGDIRNTNDCLKVTAEADYVLHQAALGSIPRSINDPHTSNEVNVSGFLNMIDASRKNTVKNFVYASSSSVYGDLKTLPKYEDKIGKPLSPYANTKLINELYANVYQNTYGFASTGLRYFNVYGKRQDPSGAYAAVIPLWISSMLNNKAVFINGDGETSRDFCFIDDVVQMNILSAVQKNNEQSRIFNVSVGGRTTLNELYAILKKLVSKIGVEVSEKPIYRDFREGDVRHSQASVDKAIKEIGYKPTYSIEDGLAKSIDWYKENI